MLRYALFFLTLSILFTTQPTQAREQIRIVGSSTLYPFVTVVAENFARDQNVPAPIVEPTGSGNGIEIFCRGIGLSFPDLVNASRDMTENEIADCKSNNVTDIQELLIGYDGIVVANNLNSPQFRLSLDDLFKALSKYSIQNGNVTENTMQRWNEVNPDLPDQPIQIYGPSSSSGTYDVLVEQVLIAPCMKMEAYQRAYPDEAEREKICGEIREDGAYIKAGEADNLIIQKLVYNDNALGIFGFSFLDKNESLVKGALINGVEPTIDNIADAKYPLFRKLFVYVKQAHLELVPTLKPFLKELVSYNAIGEDGYTVERGLVPLPEELLNELQQTVDNL